MAKYHMTENGPKICTAQEGNCPIGGQHYPNSIEAFTAYRDMLKGEHGELKTLKKTPKEISYNEDGSRKFTKLPMKELMDRFNETATKFKDDEDYEAAFELDNAESLANNCHGMSPDETLDYMNRVLKFEGDGYDKAREIVSEYMPKSHEVKLKYDEEQVMSVIRGECERQHVGEDRAQMLFKAYKKAYEYSLENDKPTLEQTLELAAILKPDSKGKIRSTNVTFADGGSAASGNTVKNNMERLYEMLHKYDDIPTDEFIRNFESTHPLTDGNGRTGWLLYNWLNKSMAKPVKLPYYNYY